MSDDFPNRRTIRLSGYDYSKNGYYFVTICTHQKRHIFGNIVGARTAVRRDAPDSFKKIPAYMELNNFGKIVESVLNTLPNRFPIKINVQQIMPNHVHFIIIITRAHDNFMDRAHHDAPLQQNNTQKRSLLSQITGFFKMHASKLIHNVGAIHESPDSLKKTPIHIFQRNYFEHIVRDEKDYFKIREYIINNPQNWETDVNYV